MVTAAVDLIYLTKLEPPAPVVSAPSAEADGPSFQQHLEQAEKRASNDSRPVREERTSEPSNEAAPERPQRTDETNESRPPEKSSQAEGEEKPVVVGTGPKAEHDGEESGDEQDQATEAQVAAAAIVQIVAPEATEQAEDEVTLTVDADEAPNIDAAKAVKKKAELTTDTPTARTSEDVVADATTQTAEVVTLVAAKPQDPERVKQAKPVGEEKQAKKQSNESAKPKETPKADVAAIEVSQAVEAVERTTATGAVVAVVDEGLNKVEEPVDQGGADVKQEAKAERSEAIVDPTTAAPQPSPTDAPTANATSPTAVVATTDVAKSDDKQTQSNETRDGSVPTADAKSEPSQTDRTTGHEPPPRTSQQRDATTVRTDGGESMRTLSHADRARLVQRVARAVQTAQDRGGDLKIRLSPPELGSLRLQVRLADGALSARIEAETPAAQQVLVENLPQLRERLAEQNIRIEKFDVDLFHSGGGGASQTPQQQFQQDDASNPNAASRRGTSRVAASSDTTGARSTTPAVTDGRLNVVV